MPMPPHSPPNGAGDCAQAAEPVLTPRILVIDDALATHEDFRKILVAPRQDSPEMAQLEAAFLGAPTRALARTGFAIDSALDGPEGLALVQQAVSEGRQYFLAFVDMRMPSGWDGIETTARLRQADPDLQIVICSALSDYSWEQITEKLGHDDGLLILKKPFDTREVLQLADALNQKWNLARQARWHLGDLDRILKQRTQILNQLSSELTAVNQTLSQEMAERSQTQTRLSDTELRLEMAQLQLAEVSRQASLAEVATGVLHNVGNVLNSVNVSVNVLAEALQRSKAQNLSGIAALLSEHASDLGQFITADPKGRQLPRYLEHLAKDLVNQDALMSCELESLTKNMDHIKKIVAMQQSYAKVCGVVETVNAQELVEDALNLNTGVLRRHGVRVIRQYDSPVPQVTVDRHKVLQVLVNLIGNAKQACDESGRPDKQMTVRIAKGGDRVCISVQDNGIGIPRESLARIFTLGFTTRKNGHGFGLHNCALAAREMGGSLAVYSEGADQGAIFTLELPICPQN
jgi:signal transduction histidine kinase